MPTLRHHLYLRACQPVCVCVCAMLSDDVDLNSVASIPGMGIPEQLKAAMEQEQSSKCHPGAAWTCSCTVSQTVSRGFHEASS